MSTASKEGACIVEHLYDVTINYGYEVADIITTQRITSRNSYLTGEAFAAENVGTSTYQVGIATTLTRIGFDELAIHLQSIGFTYGCIRALLGYVLVAIKNLPDGSLFAPRQTLSIAGYIGAPFFLKEQPPNQPIIDLDFPTERSKRIWPSGTMIIVVKSMRRR